MRIRLTRLATEILASCLVFALAIDWCCPGEGLHFAVNAKLGETCSATTPSPDGVGYAATTFRTTHSDPCGAALRPMDTVTPSTNETEIACRASDLRSKEERDAEAQRLWEEARGMTHRFKPDWEKDREYLAKVYDAARLGHLEAMVKLGEYAYRPMLASRKCRVRSLVRFSASAVQLMRPLRERG